jgi:hypothetical protein
MGRKAFIQKLEFYTADYIGTRSTYIQCEIAPDYVLPCIA